MLLEAIFHEESLPKIYQIFLETNCFGKPITAVFVFFYGFFINYHWVQDKCFRCSGGKKDTNLVKINNVTYSKLAAKTTLINYP